MRNGRIYLNAWLNSSGFQGDSWEHLNRDRARIFDIEHYVRNASIARRGTMDAIFLADQPQLTADPRERPEYPFDPITLVTAITSRVPDIGAIATATTSYSLPYTLARQIASANLLSGGRVGWNAVTTNNPNVAGNYGSVKASHDDRYARANEFLDVVGRLWRSWRFDWENSQAAAANPFGQVSPLDHRGEHFSVAGALNTPLPEFGVPVIAQAGGSPQGMQLAGLYGEVIYAALGGKGAGIRFGNEVRRIAAAAGRPQGSIIVMPGLQALIGSTEDEVTSLAEEYEAKLAPLDERMKLNAAKLGIDLGKVGPDQILEADDFNLPHNPEMPLGALKAMVDLALDERLSLRQLALRLQVVVGTPEQIADRMIDWWESGAADGFNVTSPYLPDSLETFVDQVIPLLRARGVFPSDYRQPTLRARLGLPR